MIESPAPHLEAFLDAARYFLGAKDDGTASNNPVNDKLREVYSYAGMGWCAWCAIFVTACAAKAGILNTVIASNSYANGILIDTVNKCGGTWIDGPRVNGGAPVTPIPGDLINFGYDDYHTGKDHANHVGLVEYVEDGIVHTIEGNSGNECKQKSYALDNTFINMYVRPDWSKVGDNISAYLANAGVATGPLYQNLNDRHDMTLREVGYLDSNYKLSNISSAIKVSVINYTTTLGQLYDMFAPASQYRITVDTSQLDGNTKIAMDFFLANGYSASSASGVVACLQIYSGIDPAFSEDDRNGIHHYGICAWDWDKLKELKTRTGDDWWRDLSPQLDFLLDDLVLNFKGMLSTMKDLNLSELMAQIAAQSFMAQYNKDFNIYGYKEKAKTAASEIYEKLIITKTALVGGINNLRDENGNLLSAQYSISIPATVPQTGIIDDYTSYSAWYSRWHGSSPQKKLAVMWGKQGYPCDLGIATIGGFYCAAVRPKFGKCGEIIVVTLNDGTAFACIICDEKGEDAGSEWGHIKENGNISLIEWERVKTENGRVITGTGYSDVDARGFTEWYGKKVSSITNYGKYTNVGWG